MSDQVLLRLPEVLRRVGVSRSGVYRAIRNEGFPQPRQIGKRAVAWVESEVAQWITTRPVGVRPPGAALKG